MIEYHIQRIKCFFGLHDWTIARDGKNQRHGYCFCCGKIKELRS